VAVVLAAGHILRTQLAIDLRLPGWPDWDPSARAWALGSALVLAALTVVEVGA
jgi:hypothetical protein